MEENLSDVEDGITVKTPSHSQESKLLTGKEGEVDTTNKTSVLIDEPEKSIADKMNVAKTGEGSTMRKTIATSDAPKKTHFKNANQPSNTSSKPKHTNQSIKRSGTKKSEVTMTLTTSIPLTQKESEPKANRTRPKWKRNLAKSAKDRVETDSTPKRGRESGGTPPSAQQLTKFSKTAATNDNISSVPPVTSKPQSSGSKKENQTGAVLSAISNATSTNTVPPEQHVAQSIGSKDGESSGNQFTDSLPPAQQQQLTGIDSNVEKNEEHTMYDNDNDVDEEADTYASVTSRLYVAIVDLRASDSINLMDQKRYDLLSSLITDLMITQVGKNMKLPQFEYNRLFSGAMKVKCANLETRSWLEKYIPSLDRKKLWTGANLVVIDFKNIPKPYKFNVWCKNMKLNAADIFKLLEASNDGISTKSWTVLAYEEERNGIKMTIGVGQDSFDALRSNSNSLYCGMGKATFKMVQHCKENQTKLHTDNSQENEDCRMDESN